MAYSGVGMSLEDRLFSLLPQPLLGRLFLPLGLATFILAAWNVLLLIPAVPLLCVAFLCAVREGRAGQFFFVFLLANLAASLLSPGIVERDHLLALLGIDFAVLFGLLTLLVTACRLEPVIAAGSMKIVLPLFLGLLSSYFLYGWLAGNGLAASAAYLRLYLFPFLFFLLGLVVRPYNVTPILFAIFVAYGALLAFEYVAPQSFYQVTNMADYYSLKMGKLFTPETLAERNVRKFFNFELFPDIHAYRPLGALGHPISSSYLFLFFSLWFFCHRRRVLAALALVASLVFGVKGSVIALGLIVIFEILYRIRMRPRLFFAAMFTVVLGYLLLAYLVGFRVGNPHMVKVAGALFHIPENVLGGGLGFGGSMSRSLVEGPQFDDSVLAVGLSQLGLLGIILVYTFYLALIRRVALPFLEESTVRLAFFYCIALMANSVFQEEGFSPYALGLALFMLAYAVSARSPGAPMAGVVSDEARAG
ncbi:hypothetical protein [Billgrantia antri]|uniref:Uncharacterized protein n=1 Tax=Billgrantia antri TaxID=2846777 RepID=A0ABS6ZPJ4_9GAMM|nr:hypothetical protein [Halomonas antri]MBW6391996.1 hypothetical protein [Halomonas antri]